MVSSNRGELHFHGVRVIYSSDVKANLIRLPSFIVQSLESTGISIQDFIINIVRNGTEILAIGWDGYESQGNINGEPTIELNPILAQEFKLQMGCVVDLNISKYGPNQTATEVHVEPESSDDWEIIESNSMFFQDEILHQTRVVTLGKVLICYVDNVVSKFRVKTILPGNLNSAAINTGSLIIVSPRENKIRHLTGNLKPKSTRKPIQNIAKLKRTLLSFDNDQLEGIQARVCPGELESQYALVSIVYNSLDMKSRQALKRVSGKYASNIALEVVASEMVHPGHIVLSPLAWDSLCAAPENGVKLRVEFCTGKDFNNNSDLDDLKVSIRPLISEEEASKRERPRSLHYSHLQEITPPSVFNLLDKLRTTVLTHKMVFAQERVMIELLRGNGEHTLVADFSMNPIGDNWQYFALDGVKLPLNELTHKSKRSPFLEASMKLNSLVITDLSQRLINFLTFPVTPSSCALLEGRNGMGKTTLLQQISKDLILRHGRYVRYVDCDSLLESSNLTRMKQFLQDCCSLCYWHQPSVLLLDNASTLFPNVKSEDPQQQVQLQRGGAISTKLATHLINSIHLISKKDAMAVRVILCDKSKQELDGSFFDKHFVSETFKVEVLDVDGRSNMIQFFTESNHNKLADDLQFRDIALETEGYSPLDIKLLMEKMSCNLKIHQIAEDSMESIDKELFQETLSGFTPSSLKGVKLTKNTGVKWDDIGALKGPKKLLLETLEWPVKYAPIFANCPLQLRSGVLLYGYPGCGKTLLASAVAQQCGLNFITVKGPEILDKYIGASEQNVRELFSRAQSVKPCILFFDEFDSIAPKRGHDSTGVTDRIVNQLLTQMDGVEGLDGVYVLAATSRPDLIDPALLRPGRIDKSVICNMPTLQDRRDILSAVTFKMDLVPGIDLNPVAERTEGYTGADLQGICYNAYLKAVHRQLENLQSQRKKTDQSKNPNDGIIHSVINGGDASHLLQSLRRSVSTSVEDPDDLQDQLKPSISLDDLMTATSETKSSISPHELNRLRTIYNRFQENRDGQMPNGESSVETGTRSSLA